MSSLHSDGTAKSRSSDSSIEFKAERLVAPHRPAMRRQLQSPTPSSIRFWLRMSSSSSSLKSTRFPRPCIGAKQPAASTSHLATRISALFTCPATEVPLLAFQAFMPVWLLSVLAPRSGIRNFSKAYIFMIILIWAIIVDVVLHPATSLRFPFPVLKVRLLLPNPFFCFLIAAHGSAHVIESPF